MNGNSHGDHEARDNYFMVSREAPLKHHEVILMDGSPWMVMSRPMARVEK